MPDNDATAELTNVNPPAEVEGTAEALPTNNYPHESGSGDGDATDAHVEEDSHKPSDPTLTPGDTDVDAKSTLPVMSVPGLHPSHVLPIEETPNVDPDMYAQGVDSVTHAEVVTRTAEVVPLLQTAETVHHRVTVLPVNYDGDLTDDETGESLKSGDVEVYSVKTKTVQRSTWQRFKDSVSNFFK